MFMFKGMHMSGVGMFGVGVGWVCGGGYLPTLRHGTTDTMGYGRQASGSHPTGMLSCSKKKVELSSISSCCFSVRTDSFFAMETAIEQYIRRFVHSKTEEKVELHLTPDLHIRHAKKKGSILLAVFWANLLQHPNNFPKRKYSYKKVIAMYFFRALCYI